tara:strand:- start:86 stop:565 length:480 start_codon:yes stop_codon:yes gene_type:complete
LESEKFDVVSKYDVFLVYTIRIKSNGLQKSKFNRKQLLIFKKLKKLRGKGFGYQRIADYMNERSIKTIYGKSFSGSGVQSLMRRAENFLNSKSKKSIKILKTSIIFFDKKLYYNVCASYNRTPYPPNLNWVRSFRLRTFFSNALRGRGIYICTFDSIRP